MTDTSKVKADKPDDSDNKNRGSGDGQRVTPDSARSGDGDSEDFSRDAPYVLGEPRQVGSTSPADDGRFDDESASGVELSGRDDEGSAVDFSDDHSTDLSQDPSDAVGKPRQVDLELDSDPRRNSPRWMTAAADEDSVTSDPDAAEETQGVADARESVVPAEPRRDALQNGVVDSVEGPVMMGSASDESGPVDEETFSYGDDASIAAPGESAIGDFSRDIVYVKGEPQPVSSIVPTDDTTDETPVPTAEPSCQDEESAAEEVDVDGDLTPGCSMETIDETDADDRLANELDDAVARSERRNLAFAHMDNEVVDEDVFLDESVFKTNPMFASDEGMSDDGSSEDASGDFSRDLSYVMGEPVPAGSTPSAEDAEVMSDVADEPDQVAQPESVSESETDSLKQSDHWFAAEAHEDAAASGLSLADDLQAIDEFSHDTDISGLQLDPEEDAALLEDVESPQDEDLLEDTESLDDLAMIEESEFVEEETLTYDDDMSVESYNDESSESTDSESGEDVSLDASEDYSGDASYVFGEPKLIDTETPVEETPARGPSVPAATSSGSDDDESVGDQSRDQSMDISRDSRHALGKPRQVSVEHLADAHTNSDPWTTGAASEEVPVPVVSDADAFGGDDEFPERDGDDEVAELGLLEDADQIEDAELVDESEQLEESSATSDETLTYEDDLPGESFFGDVSGDTSQEALEDASRAVSYAMGEPEPAELADSTDDGIGEEGVAALGIDPGSPVSAPPDSGTGSDFSRDVSMDIDQDPSVAVGKPHEVASETVGVPRKKSRTWLKALVGTAVIAGGIFLGIQFGLLDIESVTEGTATSPQGTDAQPDTTVSAVVPEDTDPDSVLTVETFPAVVPDTVPPPAIEDSAPSAFDASEPFFDPNAEDTPRLSDAEKPDWLKAVWARLNDGGFNATDLMHAESTITKWLNTSPAPPENLAERLKRLQRQIDELTSSTVVQLSAGVPAVPPATNAVFVLVSASNLVAAEGDKQQDQAEDLEFEARLVAADGNHLRARRLYLEAAQVWRDAGLLEHASAALRNAERHQKRLPATWQAQHAAEFQSIGRTVADIRESLSTENAKQLAQRQQDQVVAIRSLRQRILDFLDTHRDAFAVLSPTGLEGLSEADRNAVTGVAAALGQIRLRLDTPDADVVLDSVREDADTLNRILITVLVRQSRTREVVNAVDPVIAAPADLTPHLRATMHDALIGRDVYSRLRTLDAESLSETEEAQRTDDLEWLQAFVSEETGIVDPQAIENVAEPDLKTQIARIRLTEARVNQWEKTSRGLQRDKERTILKTAIEELFTDPAEWVADAERLKAAGDAGPWEQIVADAVRRNIVPGENWAEQPEPLTNTALRSVLFNLQSLRLRSQALSVAAARQVTIEATQAVTAAKTATAEALKAAKTVPAPPPAVADPDAKPAVPDEPAERQPLIAAILNRVDRIRNRLDGFAPVTTPNDPADTAVPGDPAPAGTEDAEESDAADDALPASDADRLRSLIAGLDADALQNASMSELRTIVRQTQEIEVLLDQWERTGRLENVLADHMARLASAQDSLAQQVTAAETKQLAAVDQARKSLTVQILAVETTAAKLNQVVSDLQTSLRKEPPLSAPPVEPATDAIPASQRDSLERTIEAVVRRHLEESGYGPSVPGSSGLADQVTQPENAARARRSFKAAYSSAFFSGRSGSMESAVRQFSAAVRQDPDDPIYRYFLGLALYRSDNSDQGVEQVRIGAQLEKEQDRSPGSVDQWLERVQYGQRTWLERIRRDVMTRQQVIKSVPANE
jgi:hypothetical protein